MAAGAEGSPGASFVDPLFVKSTILEASSEDVKCMNFFVESAATRKHQKLFGSTFRVDMLPSFTLNRVTVTFE